ncbi:MAG: PspC domain-containing protein [Caldilineaceae bacterium]|nr:PspC domain-containing protein [Caldilineaceae bacterium]MCB0124054.1 PspC domain-containing protein [Caldilineaceae bacterium]
MSNETYQESYQNVSGSTMQSGVQTQETQRQQSAQTLQENALYRHPTEKLVGGVCGGIAAYFGWDPALVRILWLVATIGTGGGGLLAYLVLWGLLPVGTRQTGVQQPATFALNERNIGRVATVLIVLGGVWLLANVGILPRMWNLFWFVFRVFFWPALLIGVGYMLLKGSGNANMNLDFGDLRDRLRNRMRDVRVPSVNGNGLKSNLENSRQRLPIRRSTTDRLFMGVCGGIAKRIGVDANLVRLLWAAFSIGSIGMGVLVYLVAAFILPEESTNGGVNQEHVQNVEIVEGSKTQAV